ncbi:SRPBCC family protein [Streptomyces sp. J2-1]|uniref:SRPBCC family protein n=1 Tax=Streptomyces corallincola TaxID=2851888 RepID=UPI001C385B0F|nr:SRPBCC family protein [Streptomyces corallincola]MBV2357062.1 SRPBCC family protein [Streptomyces corallincola]
MGDYSETIDVRVPPDRLFAYLSDVRHLPAYLPRLTSVRPEGHDRVTVTAHIDPPDAPGQDVTSEAWLHVVEDGKRLEWGAPGPHDYHGELRVDGGDSAGTSRLTVALHTEHIEGGQVDHGLEEAVTGIKRAAESADR